MSKKILALILCTVMCATLFAACGGGDSTTAAGGDTTSGGGGYDASKLDFNGRTLDVLFMVGGQGQMADPILAKLEEVYPGLKTNITYDHNAADVLRSRVMANDAPDIFDVNTGKYDYYSAIDEGVMKPLDFLYDIPTVDDPSKTLKDIINFSMMSFGYVDGKYYCVADSIYTSGLWYDANMFREKGYDVPTTWDEFYALGEKAKADDKTLVSFATNWAGEYFRCYWLIPLICSIDVEAFGKLQRFEEGAYSDPAVVEALKRTVDIVEKGYVDTVTSSLTSISEVQMEFCNGNVLFYCCGSWLEAEMDGNWPDGFELTYIPFPANTAGDPSYMGVMGVKSAVWSGTKNEDIVTEYFRYMLSNKETTTKVVETTMNGLPLYDFAANYGSLLPDSVSSSWAAADAGQVIGVQILDGSFYASLGPLFNDNTPQLVSGAMSVDQFVDSCNNFIAETRADDSIIKRDYDMGAIMDAIASYKAK